MRRALLIVSALSSIGRAQTCQITSPLPMPVTIQGCTFSGSLPNNSTSYIQNTLTPTTTSQQFSVQNASATASETLGYLAGTQCLHEVNGAVLGTGADCISGSGSGGGIVSPATFTWVNNFGIVGTTLTFSAFNATTTSATVTGSGGLNSTYGVQGGSFTTSTSGTYGFTGVSNALAYSASFGTQILASDGGAYFYVTPGFVNYNSAGINMTNAGTPEWIWAAPTASGKLSFTNGNQSTGAGFDVTTDGVLKIRNRAQTADAAITGSTMSFTAFQTSPTSATVTGVNGLSVPYTISVGTLTANSSSSNFIQISGLPNAPNLFSGIWLGQSSPDSSNFLLLGGATQSFMNAPSGGDIELRIANTSHLNVSASGVSINGPSNVNPPNPLTIFNSGGTAQQVVVTNSSTSFMGSAGLAIVAASPSGTYETIFGTSTTQNVAISTNGFVSSNGPATNVTSCGATPNGSVVGDDKAGVITVGGTAPTACTLNFSTVHTGCTMVCNVTDNSLTISADISSLTTSALTLGFGVGGLAGGNVYYNCTGYGPTCR